MGENLFQRLYFARNIYYAGFKCSEIMIYTRNFLYQVKMDDGNGCGNAEIVKLDRGVWIIFSDGDPRDRERKIRKMVDIPDVEAIEFRREEK